MTTNKTNTPATLTVSFDANAINTKVEKQLDSQREKLLREAREEQYLAVMNQDVRPKIKTVRDVRDLLAQLEGQDEEFINHVLNAAVVMPVMAKKEVVKREVQLSTSTILGCLEEKPLNLMALTTEINKVTRKNLTPDEVRPFLKVLVNEEALGTVGQARGLHYYKNGSPAADIAAKMELALIAKKEEVVSEPVAAVVTPDNAESTAIIPTAESASALLDEIANLS